MSRTELENDKTLADHFFRHKYAKMVAILVNYFGLSQVELAEDIVQDTLVAALEAWSTKGIPKNPGGWLMDVARKKTINQLKRNQLLHNKVLPRLKKSEIDQISLPTGEAEIGDSTLRMIFLLLPSVDPCRISDYFSAENPMWA